MNKKYVVELTAEERAQFERIAHTGKSAAWKILHAQVLLKLDKGEHGPGWESAQIAEAFGVTMRSVDNWRRQAVEDGPLSLLEREYPKRPQKVKLDGDGQAQLVRLACSQAPDGRDRWTLDLLQEKLVALGVVESISRETIRKELKKTNSNRG
jgi:transposase